MPIDYSQYLNANQRGLDTLNQTRLATLDQPTKIQSFMQGLRGGQDRVAQGRVASQQELLNQSLIKQREEALRKQQEQEAYEVSQRPMKEASAQTDIDYKQGLLKQMLTPKPVTEPSMTPYQQATIELRRAALSKQGGGGGGGGTSLPKAPSGYRYTAGGDLEAIPGGPVQGKFEAGASQAKTSSDAYANQMDRLYDIADQTSKMPGLNRVTGIMGSFPDVPGSSAADARAKFETLKSQIAFSVLQDLRSMSKTGGALGQISDKEEAMLQNNLASLQGAQSYEAMMKSIEAIKQFAQASKARIRAGYESNPSVVATSGAGQQRTSYKEGDVSKSGKYVVRNGQWVAR